MPEIKDKYPNIIYDTVTESGANTLTFEEIAMGLNIFDKVGLLLHRIEWFGFHTKLIDDTDQLRFGLSASNGFTDVNPGEPSIITYKHMVIGEIGVAASVLKWTMPLADDFSNLPGGGILITPKPLYMFIEGTNLAAAAAISMRCFFTVVKLKPEDYFELLEARQFFG